MNEKTWYGIGSKKSHEVFMEELYENNLGFRNGEFQVVGKFKGGKSKVLLRDKYGYCSVSAYDLTRGVTQKMTIKSAIFKTLYLKEYLRQNNKNFYSYYYRIVSEYKIAKESILVKDKVGNLHSITPSALLKGVNPSIKSAVDKSDFIYRKVCSRNRYFKSGEVVYNGFYIENQTTFLRVSDKFGDYKMDVSVAYSGSRPTIEVAVNKNENLVNRFMYNKGSYDYSKVVYTKMDEKVIICCELHECFEQRAINHARGEGCPKCGTQSALEYHSDNPTGWSYTNWIKAGEKSKKFDSYKVYIIKMKSVYDDEEFYKIGKTFTTVKDRFRNSKVYLVEEVLKVIESEDGRVITEKEASLLKANRIYRYKPKHNFQGYMECFSRVNYEEV